MSAESFRAAQPEHYSVGFCEIGDWWHARCSCGFEAGFFPTAEDGCDALMEHAYDMASLLHSPVEQERR